MHSTIGGRVHELRGRYREYIYILVMSFFTLKIIYIVGFQSMSMNCQTQLDLMACFPYFRDHYWYNAEPDFTIGKISFLPHIFYDN